MAPDIESCLDLVAIGFATGKNAVVLLSCYRCGHGQETVPREGLQLFGDMAKFELLGEADVACATTLSVGGIHLHEATVELLRKYELLGRGA